MGNTDKFGGASEHKRLEEELDKYRTIFENTGTAMGIIEEDTTISLVNSEFERLTGYTKEEVEGKKSWTEFVVEDDLERMKEYHRLRRVNPNTAPGNYEFQLIDKWGDVKNISLTIDIIPGTKKSVGSLLDITGHKQIEKALRASEQKYKELTDSLPQTVFETDERGNITFANRHGFDSFGYTQDDFDKGLNALQTVIPEDRDRAKENIGRILSGEILGGIEYTALRKDGGTFPVIIHSRPIIRENRPVGLRGIIVDISELKQAEGELRASEEKYRQVVENANEAILIAQDGMLKFPNPKATEILGYSKEEITSMPFVEFIHPDDREMLVERHLRRLRGEEFSHVYPIVSLANCFTPVLTEVSPPMEVDFRTL